MKLALRWIGTLWGAWLLVGCAGLAPKEADMNAAYHGAIADSAVASPSKVVPLRALPSGESVTMVSWVVATRVPCKASEVPCDMKVGKDPMWVTLAGEVQGLCSRWNLAGDALRRRMEQLLGLPIDPPDQYRKAMVVEMQVPRDRLQRPCLGLDESDPGRPKCTIDAQATTPIELRNFVGQQMAGAYVVDNPRGPGYPFTRLGYTYDWAPNAHPKHYGASEFLVAPGTAMVATRVVTTDAYCNVP